MPATHLTHVAVFGASGNVGGNVVRAILASPNRPAQVTAVTRNESSATFAAGVQVRKVDMASRASIAAALAGVQAIVITLPFSSNMPDQLRIIDAAADAGVAYVLPNEFGSDTAHPRISDIPANGEKVQAREHIVARGMKYLAVVTNPWFDYAFPAGLFNIDVAKRTASFWDDGRAQGRFSTLGGVGTVVARLLALPIESSAGGPSLEGYANKHVYTSTFVASQQEILAATQRATGTTPADWTVTYAPLEQSLADNRAKTLAGEQGAMLGWLFGSVYAVGRSGMYEGRPVANRELGLKDADLDEVVSGVIKGMQ